jgi:hypothetical protein
MPMGVDDREDGLEWLLGPREEREENGDRPDESWRRLGFESFDDFIQHIGEERRRVQGGFLEPPPRIPATYLPGAEVGDVGDIRRRRGATRQVGIKLRREDYEMLAQAAAMYDVAPSTLARMLVRRGVLAIVERESGGDSA